MTGCIVCDLPDGEYCEFCPSPDNIDTGPEEAEDITYKWADGPDGFADDLLQRFLNPPPPDPNHPANTDPDDDRPVVITDRDPGDENDARDPENHRDYDHPLCVGYRAMFRIGATHFVRQVIGYDSFHQSVELVRGLEPEAELIGLERVA